MSLETVRLVPNNGGGSGRGNYQAQPIYNEDSRGAPGETAAEDEKSDFHNEYIKSIIFGGLDGLLTSFSIVFGAAGGQFSWTVVLVLGFSSIVANAISVGAGEYLSSKAHREFVQAEKRRELWEFKNYRADEIKEMAKRFEARGMSKQDAEDVVAKMAKYEGFFVNLMVTEELGVQLPDDDDATLLADAFIMMSAFAGFGSLPLLVYCAGPLEIATDMQLFLISAFVTVVALFLLGAVKSSFSSVHWLQSGFETVFVASTCAGFAYGVGAVVSKLL